MAQCQYKCPESANCAPRACGCFAALSLMTLRSALAFGLVVGFHFGRCRRFRIVLCVVWVLFGCNLNVLPLSDLSMSDYSSFTANTFLSRLAH